MQKEFIGMEGYYKVECYSADGKLKWSDEIPNQVVQAGKILMLDTLLAGSSYTTVGPFIGLVSGTPTFSPTDTMSSHAGWTEFTTYTVSSSAVRGTATFTGASGNGSATPGSNVVTKTSNSIVYVMTSPGTVAGCFLVTGTGAVNTLSSTAGTLYSAGAFAGGSKVVVATDNINLTYATTATS